MTRSTSDLVVEAKELTKTYGRTRALHDLSFELQGGRVCVLMGPNGAGKSTLLRLLSGLVRANVGQISSRGRPASDVVVGYCGHAPLLYADLTIRENLTFFARAIGLAEVSARVEELVTELGLGAFADQTVRVCSRGTVQRASIARALLSRPRLLLLDEPFAGLDMGSIAILREVLRKEAESGAAVVISSHDFAAVAGLASHVLVLARGKLVRQSVGALLDEAALRSAYDAASYLKDVS